MKLNYNIIWVDDRSDEGPFEDMRSKLTDFLKDEFFEPNIFSFDNFADFNEEVVKHNDLDLIITDFNLGQNENGDSENGSMVIDAVRKLSPYTEIFFYSAKDELTTNPNLTNNNRVTFYQIQANGYSHLYNQLEGLISYNLKTYNHIVSMRGLIVSEASSLEKLMLILLQDYIQGIEQKDDIVNLLFDKSNDVLSEKSEKYALWKKNSRFDSLMKDPVLFSSFTRCEVIKELSNKLGTNINDYIDSFQNEVIKIRNVFAHSRLLTDANGIEYLDGKINGARVEFNIQTCRDVRKNLIKHKSAMQELAKTMIGKAIEI